MVEEIFSPFSKELIIILTEGETEEPRDSFTDIEVLFKVNGTTKLKFRKYADSPLSTGEGLGGEVWRAWAEAEQVDEIICRIQSADTEGWRGLLTIQVQKIKENEELEGGERLPAFETSLFLVKKSGFEIVE